MSVRGVQFDDLGAWFVSTIELDARFPRPGGTYFETIAMERGPGAGRIVYLTESEDMQRASRAHGLFLLRMLRARRPALRAVKP